MQTLHELGAHQRDPLRASVARSELLEHVRGFFERYDLPALPGAQAWPRINGRATDSCHCWMEVTFAALLHAAQA